MRAKDRLVAQKRIDNLYQQMERESAGIVTSKKMRDAAECYLGELVKKYIRTLEAGTRYINATESRLKTLCNRCEWKRIPDIDFISFLEWRIAQGEYTPKTKNHYLSSLNSFCSWMVENGIALSNPVEHVKPVKVRGRHALKYRALNDAELSSLLEKSNRREIYLFAVLTGLRHSEVGSIRVSDVHLKCEMPYVHVSADKTKNGNAADIKLHADLVSWFQENIDVRRMASEYLFPNMPDNRTVKRDYENAGIVTTNERGGESKFSLTPQDILHIST